MIAVNTHSRDPTGVWGAVILLALFGSAMAALVFHIGLCCYDDASFALLSRSVAEGRGYSLPFSYIGPADKWPAFDPTVGSGPVSILSVALAIKVFGAEYWVPGLTHVVLALCLLGLAAFLLLRVYGGVCVLLFLTASLALVSVVSQNSFSAWAAQLGEPLAALLVLCAYIDWSSHVPTAATAAVTGLLMGLAVLTKELSAIYVIAFIVVGAAQRMMEHNARPVGSAELRMFLALVVCGLAPLSVFELWRLSTLGLRGFYWNWREHFEFIQVIT